MEGLDPTAEARGRRVAFWLGPGLTGALVALGALGWAPAGWTDAQLAVAGVAGWMAIWWIWEAVPIGATSLLPLAAFPLLGVASVKEVARPYMHPFIVLLMAGFMAALAIERWGLHRRLSLRVLLRVGTSPARLVLGMMIASAFCSMWISNTATTLMMLPIALALVDHAERGLPEGSDPAAVKGFGMALFLGIAYASSVGGLGTPIGTPPNLIFLGVYESSFPELPPITFGGWMGLALPVVVVMIPLIWLYLTRVVTRQPERLPVGSRKVLEQDLRDLGRTSPDELAVGAVFVAMAVLWITRRIRVGEELVGWAPALGIDSFVNDATVAVVGALVLFAWPSRTKPGERLLDWATASRIPWEVVLLFGGGVSLAGVFKSSGLSEQIAHGLGGLSGLAAPLMVGAIALTVTFLTEVTSNTATTTILMPVLAAFAAASGLAPEQVMVPAVLSASCAFMLPVATAPNAIVYGSGRVPIAQMARVGFAINLFGAGLITAWVVLAL